MPALAEIASHLSVEDLRARFIACDDATEKIHLQAIMLRSQGRSTDEVAGICGFNTDWVRRLVRRYNRGGPDALKDGRRTNGKERLLTDKQINRLKHAVLNETPPGGGLWTGPKVAAWMSALLGRHVNPQLAYDYLHHLALSKQTPRPRHTRASARAQQAFKKNSADA